MKIGVVFPQTEIGNDPSVLRDFAQTAEALGFSHILAFDHVLGAEHRRRQPELRRGAYDENSAFHEVFVLFGYLAAATSTIGLTTGVLVLPQRQTALVAKQAAEIQILSGGRLRLGVGVGWNHVEYESLGVPFEHRGALQAEQVDVLRRLWSERVLDLRGKWHRIDRAGLNPLPSRPIPIWFGGFGDAAFKRAARLGEGFILAGGGRDARAALERLKGYLAVEARDTSEFGIEGIIDYGPDEDIDRSERWNLRLNQWAEMGATHLALHTMRQGLKTPTEHIAALRRYAEGVNLVGRERARLSATAEAPS